MGFLDNLESSLNSLERTEERDASHSQRRAEERNRALAEGPAADQLKNGAWTRDLFEKAAIVGHRLRTKIYIGWVGSMLRLEAKGRALELTPGAGGVTARYEKEGQPVTEPVDFDSTPEDLLNRWLSEGK